MPPKLIEKREELKEKAKHLHEIFEQAGEDMDLSKVDLIDGDSKGKAEKIRSLNDELTDIGKEIDELAELDRIAQNAKAATEAKIERAMRHSGGDAGGLGAAADPATVKSFGRLIRESGALGEQKGRTVAIEIPEVKATFATTAGWAPETTRTGRVVDFATRPVQVLDILPTGETTQAAVKYMEETTFTSAAAETAEAGTYAESALALTERTSVVQKIATFLPVTDEQLEDVPQVEGYIDRRLTFMIRQRLDQQVLVGNGTSPNLRGILNVAGIQTQAKGADPTPDTFYKSMVLIMVTGRAFPNAHVIHPTDWQDIKLLRTADGIYIWGSPADMGPDRLWGLPVALSDAITLNTGLTGDFMNFCELAIRRDVEVKVSDSHSTFFIEGKQAIRADMRAAFPVYRPAAFCTSTGI